MKTIRMLAVAAGLTASAVRAAEGTAPEESVIEPGAKVEKLAGGFKFTEGATCDAAGNVFFVDQPSAPRLRIPSSHRTLSYALPSRRRILSVPRSLLTVGASAASLTRSSRATSTNRSLPAAKTSQRRP